MVYILLADGFEEIEAVTPADILRRLGLEVTLVGVSGKSVRGSHGIEVAADCTLTRVKNETPAAVILPGGMPGAKNLDANPDVKAMLKRAAENGKLIAAICAAPMVPGRLGLLKGKKAVCYPGFEEFLEGAELVNASVVADGKTITARGAGAAAEFGFAIGAALKDRVSADFLRKSMQY